MFRLVWFCAKPQAIKAKATERGKNQMEITKYQLKEFQRLHKKNFGKNITKEQAQLDAESLIRLIYKTQPRQRS